MIETILIIGGAVIGLAGVIYAGYTKAHCVKIDKQTLL
jgi:thioredoxin reductase